MSENNKIISATSLLRKILIDKFGFTQSTSVTRIGKRYQIGLSSAAVRDCLSNHGYEFIDENEFGMMFKKIQQEEK